MKAKDIKIVEQTDILIDKVSQILDYHVDHYDHIPGYFGLDYLQGDLVKITVPPVLVAYGEKYGHWIFAILEDMTVVRTGDAIDDVLIEASKILKQLEARSGKSDDKIWEPIKGIEEKRERFSKAKEYLLANNGLEILNFKK